MFASVIVDIKNKQVNRTYDYIIPLKFIGILKVGSRCIVPFNHLKRTGYIVEIKEETTVTKNLKEILDIIDYTPILNKEFIDLGMYMANHYFSFYSTCLEAMIPTALRMKYEKVAKKVNNIEDSLINDLFKKKDIINLKSIPEDLEKSLFN